MTTLPSILYVEDDPDIQAIAKMSLETVGGFEVLACDGGKQAIEQAGKSMPELIVLDVMMPGMDGPSTLKALRELPATANTPVIFMTAKVQAAEVAQYRELGAIDVIHKPFDPMELSAQISRIWELQGQ